MLRQSGKRGSRAGLALLGAAALASACERTPAAPPAGSRPVDDDEPAIAGQEGDDPAEKAVGTPPPAGAAEVALLAEVDRELRGMKSSIYSHHTHVDEASGVFEYDCSGFLGYALARAVPDALASVQATTTRRPRSAEYVAFLESIPPDGRVKGRWQRVGRVQDLTPGDVIVWLKPADSHSTNTGHTMIVHGPVTPEPGAPAGAFIVPVADSTARPHAAGDARAAAHRTGLGEGEIVLVAGADGAPVGYRWSHGKSREKATTIALGRLK